MSDDKLVRQYLDNLFGKRKLSSDEQEMYCELESHIWDIYYEAVNNGMDSDKALSYAMMQIGEEEIVLNPVSQKKKKSRLFALMLLIAGIIFSQLLLFRVYEYTMQELINSIGVLSLGILIIISVRLLTCELIIKNYFFLWITLIFFDAIATLWFYAKHGCVYSDYKIILVFFYLLFWGKEDIEAEKNNKLTQFTLIILTGGTILLALLNNRKQAFVLLILGYILIIFYMANEEMNRILLKSFLWIIGGIGTYGILIWNFGKEYQKGRIMAYMLARRDKILLSRQKNAAAALIDRIDLNDVGFKYDTAYYWAELASLYSVLFCIIMLALYLLLASKFLKRISMYPKNNAIGYVFLLLYIFRVIYSLAMNLGFVPVTSVTLPFLSFEIETFIYDCLWIGYLLNTYFSYNIFRRNKIV